jgi:hypothetical protein
MSEQADDSNAHITEETESEIDVLKRRLQKALNLSEKLQQKYNFEREVQLLIQFYELLLYLVLG